MWESKKKNGGRVTRNWSWFFSRFFLAVFLIKNGILVDLTTLCYLMFHFNVIKIVFQ